MLQAYAVVTIAHNINTLTRCSAIAERPRCRVWYSFRQN